MDGSQPDSQPQELEQQTTYSLVRRIGEGGMGFVYEAIQHGAHGFSKRVAIKLIRDTVVKQHPEFFQNFVGEAKLVAQLIHPNIVQSYQLGRDQNAPFIAMEFLDGMDLLQLMQAHVERNILLPVSLAVFIASRVCRGLAYAHTKTGPAGQPLGIVHRDVSPQNIMISREGDVKITDFGLAKALNLMVDGEGEIVVGKVRYMSPEQARGDRTDGRSDIFSVGVVLSEMLIGVNIFAAASSREEISRVLELEIPDFRKLCPDLDSTLTKIMERSLARDSNQRYATAGEMQVELERFIYSAGYGPTSDTLAQYVKDRLDQPPLPAPSQSQVTIPGGVTTILKKN